jgi:hypothetical protein
MRFSSPVKMKSLYMRKHDFTLYKTQKKTSMNDPYMYTMQGLKNNKVIFDIEISSPHPTFNSWVIKKEKITVFYRNLLKNRFF